MKTIPVDQYDPRVQVRPDSRDWRANGDHYGKRQPRKRARRQGTRAGVLANLRREGVTW